MNTPRYAALAAKLLGGALRQTELVPHDRERGIATVERAMQARARRRRWLRGVSVFAAAASVLLAGRLAFEHAKRDRALVAIQVSPAGRGAALRSEAGQEPLATRHELAAGQRIETPADGGASLELSTGTSMEIAGSTSFRVDSQGALQRFSLQRGELSAHVAKLGAGQRFVVATPDSEVEVRGTRFRVTVLAQPEACGGDARTRLEVTEGVVELRHGGSAVAVKAGEIWPAECRRAPGATAVSVPAAAAAPRGTRPAAELTSALHGGSSPAAEGSAPVAERDSLLAQPNDLFARGLSLARAGDVNGALRAYQEIATRFPRSALAENAMVQRMRLLASTHDARARNEAKRYLARYPAGFASKEAAELAGP
jgi:hypothetical protein